MNQRIIGLGFGRDPRKKERKRKRGNVLGIEYVKKKGKNEEDGFESSGGRKSQWGETVRSE